MTIETKKVVLEGYNGEWAQQRYRLDLWSYCGIECSHFVNLYPVAEGGEGYLEYLGQMRTQVREVIVDFGHE